MSMVSRGVKAGLAAISNTKNVSAPIPSHGAPTGTYTTSDFTPTNLPEVNSEPASQGESTLKASLANQAEATFGKKGFVAPEDK